MTQKISDLAGKEVVHRRQKRFTTSWGKRIMLALFYFPLKQGTPPRTKSGDVSILKRLRSENTMNLDTGVVIDSRSGNK